MKIAIPKEAREDELRVAASPETVKKFVDLNCAVCVETGAGEHANVSDRDFKAAGATIASDTKAAIEGAGVILKVQRPTAEELAEAAEVRSHQLSFVQFFNTDFATNGVAVLCRRR